MRGHAAARGKTVLLAAAAVAASVCQAGAVSPADLNLFSGELAIKPEAPREAENPVLNFLVQKLGSHRNAAGTTEPSADTMAHTLVFQDGRQLRGELISLGKDTIVWKRGDANVQLTFARAEIRFIVLSSEAMQMNGNQWQMQVPAEQTKTAAASPSAATVKLPGGDWLYANVTSPDGESFVLSMGGESKFTVPRSAIEWMHFGLAAAPALNFTEDRMALTGWLRAGGGGKPVMKVEDGWISLPQVSWIGRNISPPARFEATFDLDPKDTEATTLWIQPFGPQPNCYGTGTVKLAFSKGELNRCIYINNMTEEKSSMPTDAGANGRASYRVLYDGVDGKLTVIRNAKAVGTWPLRDEKEAKQNAVNAGFQRGINGICLERGNGMRLARFAVQPWDGVIPKDGEAGRTQDLLSVGKEAPVLGKLESISEKELMFSGQKKVPGGGLFLQLHSEPKAAMKSDALLMFGAKGELGAAEVEIQNGRAKFQTSFAGQIEVPETALQVIRLSPAETAPAAMGALVFKNGDELPGSLISAANGAPLHWKTPNGQEVEFQPGRISGVRFAPGANDKECEGARLELRNGDLLHGLIAKMGKDEVQLKHEQLGAVKIARGQLWTIYPNPKTTVFDAANDPDSWLGVDRKAKEKPARRTDCVNLNGFFIMRPNGGGLDSTEGTAGIGRNLTGLPDKFELRCEALEPMGQEPNVTVRLSTPVNNRGSSTLDLEFYYGNLRVYGWVNTNQNSHSFWKDVALREQNGRFQPESRTEIRLFVDNKLGTVDIYSNGVHRAKSGQANNERIPGIGAQVTINGSSGSAAPLVVSHVWVGPWNGQLPEPGEAASVALANGDVAESAPVEMRGNNLILDEAGAELEVPVDRVQAIGFGGKPAAAATAGRVRLASGDSVAVDTFQFSEGKLTAHSPVLGDLHLTAEAMRELVIDAAATHFPWVAEKKKRPTAANDEKALPQLLMPGLAPQK